MAKISKTINPIESHFSSAVQSAFGGWVERVEKARGTTDGFPDLVFLMPSGFELCELKTASIVDNILWTDQVRPSQIRFHHDLALNGGRSFFMAGVWVGGESTRVDDPENWRAYCFDGMAAKYWETTGYEINQTCFEVDMMNLADSLADYIFEQLENGA